jgi:NADPH:quinone reductase-like Zn-dependent oxidoreductase
MPVPGHGQVVVRVHAAALNYRDLIVARGKHPGVPPGVIPLSDGAGEVTAIGAGVYRVKIGERVIPSYNQTWLSGPPEPDSVRGMLGGFVDGVLAQCVLLDQQGLVPMPDYLSFEEAASLPCAAVTAWSALTCGNALRPGQSVLVQGSGGVSIFALQLAKLFGARVIATTYSAEKAERLRALGAEQVESASAHDGADLYSHGRSGQPCKSRQSARSDPGGPIASCDRPCIYFRAGCPGL